LADNKGEGRKVDEEEEGGDLILPKAKRSFTVPIHYSSNL
jgi:hypothetical protein